MLERPRRPFENANQPKQVPSCIASFWGQCRFPGDGNWEKHLSHSHRLGMECRSLVRTPTDNSISAIDPVKCTAPGAAGCETGAHSLVHSSRSRECVRRPTAFAGLLGFFFCSECHDSSFMLAQISAQGMYIHTKLLQRHN